MTALLNKLLPDEERLLSEKEAATVLGLTNHKTLANWRSQGKHRDLAYLLIGRTIRYRLGALMEFKTRHTINGKQQEGP